MTGIIKVHVKEIADHTLTLAVRYLHKTPSDSPPPFDLIVVLQRGTWHADVIPAPGATKPPAIVLENVRRAFEG